MRYSGTSLLLLMDALLDNADIPLDAFAIKLATSMPAPTMEVTVADFTEATFDGYAAATGLVPSAAYYDGQGVNFIFTGGALNFLCTGPTVSQMVVGAWLTCTLAGATNKLLASCLFDAPIAVARAGDGIELSFQWRLSAAQP